MIEQLENTSIQSQNNAENVLKEPNMMTRQKPVNANVNFQDQSTQQLRPANAQAEKFSQTMNANAQTTNLFGTGRTVLLVHQEQHLSQKTNNVTIAQKDSLLIQ